MLVTVLTVMCSCIDGDNDMRLPNEDTRAKYMQEFVEKISNHAKANTERPRFFIIPQNGVELVYNYTDPDDGFRISYINAIDGIGIEDLFYDDDGDLNTDSDDDRIDMLREIKLKYPDIQIMVSDHVNDDSNIGNAESLSDTESFISFPRSKSNYHYQYIPGRAVNGLNTNNIEYLSQAKNYLYLISTDYYGSKQAMLDEIMGTNYDVVLIDLFFNRAPLDSTDIAQLRVKDNGGKRLVIAYISIGSAENYRYYWQQGWRKGNPSWLYKNYDGWTDEIWVMYWENEWQNIILNASDSYINRIINAGFDGVYLDNVEAYYFLAND